MSTINDCPKCATCGYYTGQQCILFNVPMTATDYCSKHNFHVMKCAKCGRPLYTSVIKQTNEQWEVYCELCATTV